LVCLKELGLTREFMESQGNNPENFTEILGKIGEVPERRVRVMDGLKDLTKFKKIGDEWARRVSILVAVVKSKKLKQFEKAVAFGALFYLIMPFDLIPDNIPVFGLIDDFFFLGAAVAFYSSRYGKLTSRSL